MKGNTMKVQLEQREIEIAIRQYIANQGLSIGSKLTTITFTATRSRETGIVADLVIEDATGAIPGFTNRAADVPMGHVDTVVHDLTQAATPNTVGAAIVKAPVEVPAEDPALAETSVPAVETKADAAEAGLFGTTEAAPEAAPTTTGGLFA